MTVFKDLIDAIEKSDVIMTFGLQEQHIKKIEEDIKRFDEMIEEGDSLCLGWRKFDASFWEKWGKEFGWQPLTLALHYFNYIEYKK